MTASVTVTYDVFVNEPPAHAGGFLPNGELKGGSPVASTLICGTKDAVLIDPAFTTDQAQALGNWVAEKGRNVSDLFITDRHASHWFAARLLPQRVGAPV